MNHRLRGDAVVTLLALGVLIGWEVSGLDLAVTRLIAGPAGFAWRDAWVTQRLLHDGGRWLAGAVLLGLVLDALRPPGVGPSRAARWRTIGTVLLGLMVVPLLKRASATSCPWDLAEFGGRAAYVPHWLPGVADGGPGHCFPSGHAVAAFAFFALYFHWRDANPARARAWGVAVLLMGAVFGAAQVLRGAHFVSHVGWSAWVCWVVAAGASAVADAVLSRRRRRRLPHRAAADGNQA